MGNIVKLHHNIALGSGVMTKPGVAWGNNALQTITIARHTPFNPQQAVGYKGIVDYTSSPVTSDLTLDCILTEGSDIASSNSSVYKHAETEVTIGAESYVLTSCNINFQAGNPATVNYGYITAGLASELVTIANSTILKDGEEAAFAVVMGEDGKGVNLVATGLTGGIPAGAQTVGFTCSLNRNQILDVRSSSPVQFVTTYPLDLSMNLELLQKIDEKKLTGLTVNPGPSTDGAGLETHPYGNVSGSKASHRCTCFVIATGLKLTESGENISVGGNLTYTYNYTAADICIPLGDGQDSNSSSLPDPSNSEP